MDFGTVRVSDAAEKKMTIKNTGKYVIAYSFSSKAGGKSEIVTLVPDGGNVEPGKEATILVGPRALLGLVVGSQDTVGPTFPCDWSSSAAP